MPDNPSPLLGHSDSEPRRFKDAEEARAYAGSDECRARFDAAKKTISAPPLELRITAGDAEMVVSWAEWALIQNLPNPVLRAATERFREAFNAAARKANSGA